MSAHFCEVCGVDCKTHPTPFWSKDRWFMSPVWVRKVRPWLIHWGDTRSTDKYSNLKDISQAREGLLPMGVQRAMRGPNKLMSYYLDNVSYRWDTLRWNLLK